MTLIGHEKQWKLLNQSVNSDRLAHAYLFTGQEKLGKKTLALEFAKQILKEDIAKKQHPDFIYIEPEEKEIKISQIREFIWRLSLKSYSGLKKVAIIDQAQSMNSEAQNCFLKTLEEPKGDTVIILVTAFPQTLLPTILSRCEELRFYPISAEKIIKYLQTKNIAEKEVAEIARLSLGRPGIAVEIAADPIKLSQQKQIVKDLLQMISLPLANRFGYVKTMPESPRELEKIINTWVWYLRSRFIDRLAGGKATPGLQAKSISQLAGILKTCQDTQFLLTKTNASPRLALEILMMEL